MFGDGGGHLIRCHSINQSIKILITISNDDGRCCRRRRRHHHKMKLDFS